MGKRQPGEMRFSKVRKKKMGDTIKKGFFDSEEQIKIKSKKKSPKKF